MQALSLMSSASTVIVKFKKKKKTVTQSLGIKVALCVWELGFSLGQMTCKASTTSNGGFRNCKIHLDFSGQQGREYGQANLHCLHPHMEQSEHTKRGLPPCSPSLVSPSAFCHFRLYFEESTKKCDQPYRNETTHGCIVSFPNNIPQDIRILMETEKSLSTFKPQLGWWPFSHVIIDFNGKANYEIVALFSQMTRMSFFEKEEEI